MHPSRHAYVGPDLTLKTVKQGDAVGARGRATLRRVSLAKGPFIISENRDRSAVERLVYLGYLRRDRRCDDIVYLTGTGRAFLDRLMRCE